MNKQKYIQYAKEHEDKLLYLIDNWHPLNVKPYGDIEITAPRAQMACDVVGESIKIKEQHLPAPGLRFKQALEKNDWLEIDKLLNSTWFGVPESTDCWQIKGFKEAIHLMEDPPNE